MNFLLAHILGSVAGGFIYTAIGDILYYGYTNPAYLKLYALAQHGWYDLMVRVIVEGLVFSIIFTIFTLPISGLAWWAVNKAGYQSKADYLLLGMAAGLACAYVLDPIIGPSMPEWNHYEELHGLALLLTQLTFYTSGALVGMAYAAIFQTIRSSTQKQ